MPLEFNFHAHQQSIYCNKHICNHFSNLDSQEDPTKCRCFNLGLSLRGKKLNYEMVAMDDF